MKNGASGTTANAWADGDDRASFGKKAASKNASSTWNYRSCLDFIEDELEDIACASTNIYDEEDPFFDEDEPTPFERGYGRILAVIRAAKEGEERLREYVRQQAEFLGITGKHARGQENFSTLLFEMTRFLASLSVAYTSEVPPRLVFGGKSEEKKRRLNCSLPPPPSPFRSLAQQARERF